MKLTHAQFYQTQVALARLAEIVSVMPVAEFLEDLETAEGRACAQMVFPAISRMSRRHIEALETQGIAARGMQLARRIARLNLTAEENADNRRAAEQAFEMVART